MHKTIYLCLPTLAMSAINKVQASLTILYPQHGPSKCPIGLFQKKPKQRGVEDMKFPGVSKK